MDEFLGADLYVIGISMYNFSVPSTFKAYIDQIVRAGRTFAFEPEDSASPYKPLVLGKKMFIITARGGSGFGPGERNEKLNHQDPHLRTVFDNPRLVDLQVSEVIIRLAIVPSQVLQQAVKQLYRGWEYFQERGFGFPTLVPR